MALTRVGRFQIVIVKFQNVWRTSKVEIQYNYMYSLLNANDDN